MNPASQQGAYPASDEAGGYAPQPVTEFLPGFSARAAAHSYSSLYVAFGVGVAIAVLVNAIVPVASRVIEFGEPPTLRQLPAYHGSAGSEAVVCGVTSEVCRAS